MTPAPLLLARVPAPMPIGPVLVVCRAGMLAGLDFGTPEERLLPLLRARFGPDMVVEEADDPYGIATAVRAYFDGDLAPLAACPVDGGGSPFQRKVWAALRAIPAGETRSYGAIAAGLGQPGAARAVGLANGSNPINIAVPCHRVVGSTGALTGYGGGLERKLWLLAHERAVMGIADDLFGQATRRAASAVDA